ncbi:hypothetical protein [Rhodohalobacter barkolensis]|uniref:YARHG domain-containing protein n=1 Tax=Rhodohalobacter barkolensis TaxID=2053187 RepID=A0A2N0VF77_9BACT|nr:hypothetical protein [Rhodohalobacter barkolensis]PKD42851.1 hypothetical protein CWD77_13450 [Rhodohalobacter barkolensis]
MKIAITTFTTLLFATLMLTTPVYSQVQNEADISSSEMRNMLDSNQIPVHRATNTEGSPYLFEDFYEGIVSLENGYSTRPLQIRYNTHTQSIDFMSGNLAFNVSGEQIESFEFTANEKVHQFKKGFDLRGISEDDFVEVVSEGEATFVVRHNTNFFEDAASYGQATQQDRYVTDEVFYLKVGNDDFNRIRRPNQRRVMRNFDRFEDELEQFADQQNLDFSNRLDIARLVDYYNSLAE